MAAKNNKKTLKRNLRRGEKRKPKVKEKRQCAQKKNQELKRTRHRTEKKKSGGRASLTTRPRHIQLAHDLYDEAPFNNKANRNRTILVVIDKIARPARSITRSCRDDARAKGAYRLLGNYQLRRDQKLEERVTPEQLWNPIFAHSVEQSREVPLLYVVQDTTCLMYPTLNATEGLGTVDREVEEALWMHSAIGVQPDGYVLGLYDAHVWARPREEFGKGADCMERPFEEKESYLWVQASDAVAGRFREHQIDAELIYINDRASDVHEVLQHYLDEGRRFIVRFARDRKIAEDGEYIRPELANQAVLDRRTITIPRTREHPAREATVEVRATMVTIDPPRQRKDRDPFEVNVVWVHEPNPPKGVEPVDWILLTTEPLETAEDCWAVVEAYKKRWRIEDYHRVLKSDCEAEETQLKTARGIMRLLAVLAIPAIRILQFRDLARTNPTAPCTLILEEYEWKVLWTLVHEEPPYEAHAPPTVAEAVKMIARLDGYLGRKGDGMPGVDSITHGLRELEIATNLCRILNVEW